MQMRIPIIIMYKYLSPDIIINLFIMHQSFIFVCFRSISKNPMLNGVSMLQWFFDEVTKIISSQNLINPRVRQILHRIINLPNLSIYIFTSVFYAYFTQCQSRMIVLF